MRFDDRQAHVQAHAHSCGLGGEERLENALAYRLVDAFAAIDDRNHCARVGWFAADRDIPTPVGAILHGLACVVDEVEHDLLNLHPVSANGWKRILEAQRQRNVVNDQVVVDNPRNLAYGFVQIEVFRCKFVALIQGPQSPNYRHRALVVFADIAEDAPQFLKIG